MMKSLQTIVLFLGLVTLDVNAVPLALTSEDVASAAVADYNRRRTPPNIFKLLRIIGKKEQDLSEVNTYQHRLLMKETTCNADVGIEIDGCDFKNGGVTMICTTQVVVTKRSPTQPRVFSMMCKTVDTQRQRFTPDEWAVLARQIVLSSSDLNLETNHSTRTTSTVS
ncbi:cathelicidin-1-like isoform X1 [Heterodontus francisci]|uniref:cathelicidin-1-like isoform X1 n=1 Tax=Heterodontus francisci TaxID=7792 RepID=UPI00355C4817